MPLPSSGTLSLQQINAEFGRGTNLNSYRGTQWYTAAGGSGTFPTGAISINDFFGKQLASPSFSFTISSHQANANLRSLAVAAGWNQSSSVTATIASGIYIYSTDVGTPALTINGSFPNGVTLVNNGYIMGMGGNGGSAPYVTTAYTTSSNTGQTVGGTAISLGVSCYIQNNSYIGGGGGGGGGGTSTSGNIAFSVAYITGAGGAGGGAGGAYTNSSSVTTPGALGGGIGSFGSAGTQAGISSGGGGRIMPGSRAITSNAVYGGGTAVPGYGGEGGVSGGAISITLPTTATAGNNSIVGVGGSAGGGGAAAVSVTIYTKYASAGGGGGGWGASGGAARGQATSTTYGNADATFTGAAGGKCVHLNGFTATFIATGTRYGAIS